MEQGIARGIAVFRWLALSWAWIGVLLERDHLEHPWIAVVALVAATVYTAAATLLVARGDTVVFAPWFVALEVVIGAALLALDGWVYDASRDQSLPWAWPAAGIITAAVVWGPRLGLAVAGVAALGSFAGESLLRSGPEWTVASASKSALYVLAALAAAYVATRLREAEAEISTVRAREQIARTLHDGVLQTLAAIQRRSDDEALRALAFEQDRDLRRFLFGVDRPPGDLTTALRDAGDLVARRHGMTAQIVLADDLPDLDNASVTALSGAMTEALTNAAKHSGAGRVVVYAEPTERDGEVFCSVRDDGCGFDPDSTGWGEGLRRSIHERIAEVGGRVEIESKPGRGTEVRLWVS